MGKEKDKTKKDERPKNAVSAAGAAYIDGQPFDRVQYLQAKLILKPDRFTSVQSFRDFGKLVQRAAKKVGVGFISDPKAGHRPEVREIIFIDTPDFRLYNNAFILRRRICYDDGFPVGSRKSSSSSATLTNRLLRRWTCVRRSPANTASSSKVRLFRLRIRSADIARFTPTTVSSA